MVEGNGLENRRARKGTVGSNPTLSATVCDLLLQVVNFAERVRARIYQVRRTRSTDKTKLAWFCRASQEGVRQRRAISLRGHHTNNLLQFAYGNERRNPNKA